LPFAVGWRFCLSFGGVHFATFIFIPISTPVAVWFPNARALDAANWLSRIRPTRFGQAPQQFRTMEYWPARDAEAVPLLLVTKGRPSSLQLLRKRYPGRKAYDRFSFSIRHRATFFRRSIPHRHTANCAFDLDQPAAAAMAPTVSDASNSSDAKNHRRRPCGRFIARHRILATTSARA